MRISILTNEKQIHRYSWFWIKTLVIILYGNYKEILSTYFKGSFTQIICNGQGIWKGIVPANGGEVCIWKGDQKFWFKILNATTVFVYLMWHLGD